MVHLVAVIKRGWSMGENSAIYSKVIEKMVIERSSLQWRAV